MKKTRLFAIMASCMVITMTGCHVTVPEGYTGVKYNTKTGIMEPEGLPSGRYQTGVREVIVPVCNKQQTLEYNDVKIWGESADQTAVYAMNVTITYQVKPEYSVWMYKNVKLFETLGQAIPDTIIESAVKNAMHQLKTFEVTYRDKVEPLATAEMQNALTERYQGNEAVKIIDVAIKQMDFDESYNAAIAKRSELKILQEQAALENETKVANAKAEAEAAAAKAEAEKNAAEAKAAIEVIEAKAYAEASKIRAEADAEELRMIAENLTAEYLEYEKYQRWNGQLPSHTNGEMYIGIGE